MFQKRISYEAIKWNCFANVPPFIKFWLFAVAQIGPVIFADIDECATGPDLCPAEQPDCLNTPGAYLCICYEYDNTTNTCKGIFC